MKIDNKVKSKVKKYFKYAVQVGSDLAEVAIHVKGKPSILSTIAMSSRVLNSYSGLISKSARNHFIGWQDLPRGATNTFFYKLCKQKGIVKTLIDNPDKRQGIATSTEIYGTTIGWVEYEGWMDGPYLEGTESIEEVSQKIGRFIWESVGTNSVAIEVAPTGDVVLKADHLTDALSSETAKNIYSKLDAFIKKGYNRSVLFYGLPGTGKSHIMRNIAQMAGGFSVRFSTKTLSKASDISFVLNQLKPSAVLIDDFDRIRNPGSVLADIEEIKRTSSIFLVSVNNTNAIDPAMLRPGRFDEFILVDKLEDKILNHLLKDIDENISSKLRNLPIAYIDEFKKVNEVLGPEKALGYVQNFIERAEKIKKNLGKANVSWEPDEDEDDHGEETT